MSYPKDLSVGDLLEGDEGYGSSQILVTQILELPKILARAKLKKDVFGIEQIFTLEKRDWSKVDHLIPMPYPFKGQILDQIDLPIDVGKLLDQIAPTLREHPNALTGSTVLQGKEVLVVYEPELFP